MATPWGDVGSPPVSELIARAGPAGILWSAKKFPWVRIESFASTCGGGVLNSWYQDGYSIPGPGITKVSVKKQGELGTTRRAVISMLAFNNAQLQQLQNCFFIPGMSVRVQFGWSVCASGGVPSPITGEMPDTEAACKLSGAGPCMDGLQGRVAHFSYTLSNNVWECTVEIIGAAEGVGGLSIDNNCCKCPIKVKDEKGDDTSKNVPHLLAKFIHIASKSSNASAYPELAGKVMMAEFRADKRDPDGSKPTGIISMIADIIDKTVEESYISFGALEEAINADQPKAGGKNVAGKLRSEATELKSPAGLMSSDPRVCLVNTGKQKSILEGTTGNFPAFGGKLENIMINCIFLGQAFRRVYDSGGTLMDFVKDVLAGINDACGGLWEFDVIGGGCGNDQDVPLIQVISNKGIPGGGAAIPSNGVRDIKVDLKLTDAMKTAALFSNRSSGISPTCSKKDSCAEVSLFYLAKGTKNTAYSQLTSDPPPCNCGGVSDPEIVGEPVTYASSIEKLKKKVSDDTVQGFKPFLVESYRETSVKECEGTFLPMSFGFTSDGIGGFKFGQIISSDKISGGNYVFQVTTAEHEVSAQDWTTTVSTITRFKP